VRVLVVSDIHGNWPALEAVAAVPHDAVLCLGDIVGSGQRRAAEGR
jgi:protein phosphatase